MKKFILGILLISSFQLFAQNKPIGTWTAHLPYQSGTSITSDGIRIYIGTQTGLFTYNAFDNSISTYSKTNLLNDIGIGDLAFSKEFSTLIVVYNNANIDLITNGVTYNIPFVEQSSEIQKSINSITIQSNIAYLSFDFGVVALDIFKREIIDTYRFSVDGVEIPVNSTISYNGRIYAGTNNGLYSASNNDNLLDFNSWSKNPFKHTQKIETIFPFQDKLAVVFNGETAVDSAFIFDGNTFVPNDILTKSNFISMHYDDSQYYLLSRDQSTVLDRNLNDVLSFNNGNKGAVGSWYLNNRYFVVNDFHPLLEFSNIDGALVEIIKPNSPFQKDIFDIDIVDNIVWTVAGSHDISYNNTFVGGRIYILEDGNWTSYIDFREPSLQNAFDILSVTVDPNNGRNAFMSSWGRGMVHHNQDIPFIVYNETNSSLKVREALRSSGWIGTGESVFDNQGNLWVTNSYQVNALSVRKANGDWKSFNFSEVIRNDETVSYDIIVDDNGYKWFTLPRRNEIVVFDDNGTIDDTSDDQIELLTPEEGKGNIPGARGIKIEKDKNGLIIIGTTDGIAIHNNPANIFNSQNKDFDRVIFFDGENNEIVLQNTTIKDIAIDGENRKWIGTEDSGVLLLSEDLKETILEFNEDNSPLLSNSINAISINDQTGEVFIATSNGLISYQGSSVDGSETFSEFKVFPNPVRENYNGPIVFRGLLDNTTIKITDISGKLINELKSIGGQVIWDGRTLRGERPKTGVYLIFSSAEDADDNLETKLGKILFVN